MRAMLLIGLMVLFAALNLVLNYELPSRFKLLIIPIFSIVLIAAIANIVRRQP